MDKSKGKVMEEEKEEKNKDQEKDLGHSLSAHESLIKITPEIKIGAKRSIREGFIDLLQEVRPARTVASSSKKGRQGVQEKSLLNFYFEGKTQSPSTLLKPGAYCEQLLLLENNGRAVVGAPKINPSLGKALDSTKSKKRFLKTTQYNPSACTKRCPKLLTATKEKNSDQKIEKCETEGSSKRGSIVGLDKEAQL